MMKSFVRLSVVLGIVGSHLLINPGLTPRIPGLSHWGTQPALALTQEEIVQKLGSVPVFTITNAEGSPLVGTAQNGDQQASVVEVFISRQDALAFIEQLKTENPELASSVQVTAVPLGKIYEIGQKSQGTPDRLMFAFVPTEQQVNSARSVLQQNGQQVDQFSGVPLFLARSGANNQVITLQQGEKQAIPFFFSREDLQGMLEQFQAQQPGLIDSVKIEVVPLEVLLEAFRTDDDQFLDLVQLIPSRETVEYIKTLQQQSSGN